MENRALQGMVIGPYSIRAINGGKLVIFDIATGEAMEVKRDEMTAVIEKFWREKY